MAVCWAIWGNWRDLGPSSGASWAIDAGPRSLPVVGEGPLTSRSRGQTLLLWLSLLAGVGFAVGLIGAVLVLADDTTIPPGPTRTRTPTPTASVSPTPTPTPSTTARDVLEGVDTRSVDFGAQAAAWICHTPTLVKPMVGPGPERRLETARAQWALERMGVSPVDVDGWFTDQTSIAVQRLQSNYGQDIDGRIGREAWEVIEDSLCDGGVSEVPPASDLLGVDPDTDRFAQDAYAVLCSSTPLVRPTPSPAPSEWVLLAQFALQRLTGQPVVVDGVQGPATTAAVRSFQQAAALPVTGVVDAPTWRQLRVRACIG